MPSILDAIETTKRLRANSVHERRRRQRQEPIEESCREILHEARALGLDLDDLVSALRQQATQQQLSH